MKAKKLVLKKLTIANLGKDNLKSIRGGATLTCAPCDSFDTCRTQCALCLSERLTCPINCIP